MSFVTDPIRLAGGVMKRCRHVCAFFHNSDEEHDVLLPFAKEGYDRGEKGFHVVDPNFREERLRRLAAAGLNGKSNLDVATWHEAYLRNGQFDQDDMLALIVDVLNRGREEGYALTRLWANMEWALTSLPGVEQLVEYETRLNHILPEFDDVVVCSYDLSRFGAGVAMDILRTHPMVIIGGLLQENPFYIPPQEFLAEIRGRKTKQEQLA